jgi:hypothetical protein
MSVFILAIIGVVLSLFGALPFFGITGPRLFKYAKDVTSKRSRGQIGFLVLTIVLTASFVFVVVWGFANRQVLESLGMILFVPVLWVMALIDVWELKVSQTGEKVWHVVRRVAFLPTTALIIAGIILTNNGTPLWLRLIPFLSGSAAGVGIASLVLYVSARRGSKRLSQKTEKDSAL